MLSHHFHQRLLSLSLFLIPLAAPAQTSDTAPVTKYKLFDLGSFGGTFSGFYNADYTYDDFTPRALNSTGDLAGFFAPTPTSGGSFRWSRGGSTILPNLPNGDAEGSNAFGINNSGLVVGASSYGVTDPNNGNSYYLAVSWKGSTIHNLGTLGGPDSWANFINNAGLVIGYAYNQTPDPFSFYGTQYHATAWLNGQIHDLGTLGGTDSEAWKANDRGSVIGISYLDSNPIPPFNQPQDNAFLWQNGTMTDLGTLGGAFSTPTDINLQGDVAVVSYDSTNQYFQSYIWSGGKKRVLSAAGGNFNEALTLNDLGVSTGAASDSSDTTLIAAAWGSFGRFTNLGTVGSDTGSVAFGINRHNVIVGGSGIASPTSLGLYAHAFVWQNGVLTDLNALIPSDSTLVLNVAYAINDEGVIAGSGTTSAGDVHAFILQPISTAGESFESAASRPVISNSSIPARPAAIQLFHPMHGQGTR